MCVREKLSAVSARFFSGNSNLPDGMQALKLQTPPPCKIFFVKI
jgi:hypothetical protein